jgi:hypothetical protein
VVRRPPLDLMGLEPPVAPLPADIRQRAGEAGDSEGEGTEMPQPQGSGAAAMAAAPAESDAALPLPIPSDADGGGGVGRRGGEAAALASLKQLCDCGLLPEVLYRQNVAAIERSTRRLAEWQQRLGQKAQTLQSCIQQVSERAGQQRGAARQVEESAERVKSEVRREMDRLRKVVDAKESALLADLDDMRDRRVAAVERRASEAESATEQWRTAAEEARQLLGSTSEGETVEGRHSFAAVAPRAEALLDKHIHFASSPEWLQAGHRGGPEEEAFPVQLHLAEAKQAIFGINFGEAEEAAGSSQSNERQPTDDDADAVRLSPQRHSPSRFQRSLEYHEEHEHVPDGARHGGTGDSRQQTEDSDRLGRAQSMDNATAGTTQLLRPAMQASHSCCGSSSALRPPSRAGGGSDADGSGCYPTERFHDSSSPSAVRSQRLLPMPRRPVSVDRARSAPMVLREDDDSNDVSRRRYAPGAAHPVISTAHTAPSSSSSSSSVGSARMTRGSCAAAGLGDPQLRFGSRQGSASSTSSSSSSTSSSCAPSRRNQPSSLAIPGLPGFGQRPHSRENIRREASRRGSRGLTRALRRRPVSATDGAGNSHTQECPRPTDFNSRFRGDGLVGMHGKPWLHPG